MADFVFAAADRSELRRLMPFISMFWFRFSRCTRWPFDSVLPRVRRDGDDYKVSAGDEAFEVRVFGRGDAIEAAEIVVQSLPAGCGAAVAGTEDDLIASFWAHVAARARTGFVNLGGSVPMRIRPVSVLSASTLLTLSLAGTAVGKGPRDLEEMRRIDELVASPSRSGTTFYASLDWVVDSCDLLAIGRLVEKDGRVATKYESTFKPANDARSDWPAGDEERFREACRLYRPNDCVMFAWRRDAEGKWKLYDWFPLAPTDDPRRHEKYPSNDPVDELDGRRRMYEWRRGLNAGFRTMSIDVEGSKYVIVADGEDLLARMRRRVAKGSSVPANSDREAVDRGESNDAGWLDYGLLALGSEVSPSDFPALMRPGKKSSN